MKKAVSAPDHTRASWCSGSFCSSSTLLSLDNYTGTHTMHTRTPFAHHLHAARLPSLPACLPPHLPIVAMTCSFPLSCSLGPYHPFPPAILSRQCLILILTNGTQFTRFVHTTYSFTNSIPFITIHFTFLTWPLNMWIYIYFHVLPYTILPAFYGSVTFSLHTASFSFHFLISACHLIAHMPCPSCHTACAFLPHSLPPPSCVPAFTMPSASLPSASHLLPNTSQTHTFTTHTLHVDVAPHPAP